MSNGVDLERFRPRMPLPEKPQRAAIFSNYSTESRDTGIIRQACQALELPLFPDMSDEETERVIDAVKKAAARLSTGRPEPQNGSTSHQRKSS